MIFFGRIFYFQQWPPSWLGAGSSDTILKGDHPSTTNLAKFSPNWPSGFRGEYIKIQKVNDGRTDDGRPVVANAHMTLKKLLRK